MSEVALFSANLKRTEGGIKMQITGCKWHGLQHQAGPSRGPSLVYVLDSFSSLGKSVDPF